MKLRPCTLSELVARDPGAEVFYRPILDGDRVFRGALASEPFQLGDGTWVAHVDELEPAYGEFVGLPGRRRVTAALLQALSVRGHTEPGEGRWASSYSDEHWPSDRFFDTRDEAVEYAAEQEHRYVGRVFNLTDDDIAAAFVRDWEDADEQIRCQDEWSWREDDVVNEPTLEAREELHQLVKAWVARHSLRVPTWRVDEIEGPFDWSTEAEQSQGSNDAEPRQAQGGAS